MSSGSDSANEDASDIDAPIDATGLPSAHTHADSTEENSVSVSVSVNQEVLSLETGPDPDAWEDVNMDAKTLRFTAHIHAMMG